MGTSQSLSLSSTTTTKNTIVPPANSSSPSPSSIPQFTISELTPTYHFHEQKGSLVFGCAHYMRECKLRHPTTGELYTCRLCCEEIRQSRRYKEEELPQLDRYNITEVLCMVCGSLQPCSKSCINPDCCGSGGEINATSAVATTSTTTTNKINNNNKQKQEQQQQRQQQRPFAKYYCDICHLYDDSGNSIYHCPYCNVCRKGQGLGIDFRHCMRCNACVAINEKHKCIPQRLQGNCPICHETMFESTEPLRALKCGHVLHLSCFNEYMSRATMGRLTCPLCKLTFGLMTG